MNLKTSRHLQTWIIVIGFFQVWTLTSRLLTANFNFSQASTLYKLWNKYGIHLRLKVGGHQFKMSKTKNFIKISVTIFYFVATHSHTSSIRLNDNVRFHWIQIQHFSNLCTSKFIVKLLLSIQTNTYFDLDTISHSKTLENLVYVTIFTVHVIEYELICSNLSEIIHISLLTVVTIITILSIQYDNSNMVWSIRITDYKSCQLVNIKQDILKQHTMKYSDDKKGS